MGKLQRRNLKGFAITSCYSSLSGREDCWGKQVFEPYYQQATKIGQLCEGQSGAKVTWSVLDTLQLWALLHRTDGDVQ